MQPGELEATVAQINAQLAAEGPAALPVQDHPAGRGDLGLGRLRRAGRRGRRPLLRGLPGVAGRRRADQPGEPRRQALRPRSGARQGALGQERGDGRRAFLTWIETRSAYVTLAPSTRSLPSAPRNFGHARKENAMEYATLGNTGLLVSKLCFGTMTFGDGRGLFKALSTVGQSGADELVKTSIDGGINFFDTADNYTEGESEKILGQSLKNLNIARQDVVIATKVYSRVGPGRNDVGASRGHIMDGVEASLRRLQTDHIDLYQIHGNDFVTPLEETLRALDTLVQQGKVRYVGCSNWQAWKIAKALGISEFRNLARFDTLQAYYSVAGRDIEREIVPLLESEKTGLLVWSPLAGGLLSGKFSRTDSEACGFTPHRLRFPPRGQRADLEDPRRNGSDRESTRM